MSIMGEVFESIRDTSNAMEKKDRLRQARKKAGYPTASAAAEALGVNNTTYTSHENGHRDFDDDMAAKYAKRFGVDPAWLVFGRGDEPGGTPSPDLGDMGDMGVEDEILFREAYREALEMERGFIGGKGPVIKRAKLVWMIYEEKLAAKNK